MIVKHNPVSEFLYQLFALILAMILVHTIYVTLVRPQAEAILDRQRALQAAGEAYEVERSIYVVVKDYEQEACFILGLWVLAIIGMKGRTLLHERRLLGRSLLDVRPGTSILPEDVRQYSRPLQLLPAEEREYLLPRTLLTALQRFGSTRNIQDVSTAVKEVCETESERLYSELSLVRYIIWAIPAIGFIGTVRGIGEALGQAHKAVEGDIVGVTVSLGVAFNSTFIALLISIFIMFLMHQITLFQERLVLDTQHYCDVNLIRNLQVR
ncbi:MotA/TolQ/ExbB proton channel family protein [Elongatibacter sediminis]|uniref:MotA/TolQ/ExbB proton channel family protein n=1 Tax=Elongatibacter sediminis TaxID=3119006 RepID=A0AAW9R501_9GAMM